MKYNDPTWKALVAIEKALDEHEQVVFASATEDKTRKLYNRTRAALMAAVQRMPAVVRDPLEHRDNWPDGNDCVCLTDTRMTTNENAADWAQSAGRL